MRPLESSKFKKSLFSKRLYLSFNAQVEHRNHHKGDYDKKQNFIRIV